MLVETIQLAKVGAITITVSSQFLSRRSRQRERRNALRLSICLSVYCQNAKNAIFSKTKQFRAIWSLLTIYRKSYMDFSKNPILDSFGCLKSKMAEIRRSDLDNISQTGAEYHADSSDMVKIETRSRIPIWRTFWGIQWHVIPEPRATLQGERIPSAILKNRFSPYFILLFS